MSNLKPSEKDIQNIVCDLAAQADLVLGIVCPFFVFMIVYSLGQSLKAQAGDLEHELVLREIMSNLKPSEKDIQNIVFDMAASADLSSGIVCSFFVFMIVYSLGQSL